MQRVALVFLDVLVDLPDAASARKRVAAVGASDYPVDTRGWIGEKAGGGHAYRIRSTRVLPAVSPAVAKLAAMRDALIDDAAMDALLSPTTSLAGAGAGPASYCVEQVMHRQISVPDMGTYERLCVRAAGTIPDDPDVPCTDEGSRGALVLLPRALLETGTAPAEGDLLLPLPEAVVAGGLLARPQSDLLPMLCEAYKRIDGSYFRELRDALPIRGPILNLANPGTTGLMYAATPHLVAGDADLSPHEEIAVHTARSLGVLSDVLRASRADVSDNTRPRQPAAAAS